MHIKLHAIKLQIIVRGMDVKFGHNIYVFNKKNGK